jgi:hypothetical protein
MKAAGVRRIIRVTTHPTSVGAKHSRAWWPSAGLDSFSDRSIRLSSRPARVEGSIQGGDDSGDLDDRGSATDHRPAGVPALTGQAGRVTESPPRFLTLMVGPGRRRILSGGIRAPSRRIQPRQTSSSSNPKWLRSQSPAADRSAVTERCAQCLIALRANHHQAPTGEILCVACYSALWGSRESEELRMRVEAHSGLRSDGRPALITRR